jgi:hypothetical protein
MDVGLSPDGLRACSGMNHQNPRHLGSTHGSQRLGMGAPGALLLLLPLLPLGSIGSTRSTQLSSMYIATGDARLEGITLNSIVLFATIVYSSICISVLPQPAWLSHLMADRTFSRLQASPPNVLGCFQGTPGTPSNPTFV